MVASRRFWPTRSAITSATPAVDAWLRLLEKLLIPLDGYSTLNLFTDLLINDGRVREVVDAEGVARFEAV